jgi:hypothetical protein
VEVKLPKTGVGQQLWNRKYEQLVAVPEPAAMTSLLLAATLTLPVVQTSRTQQAVRKLADKRFETGSS